MRSLNKTDVIGKRIAEVIISMPDIPVTMSTHSYSAGFLRLNTGEIIDLRICEPPLLACEERDVCEIVRDRKYEKEFRPAIGETIIAVTLPDEKEDGDLEIITANGFVITYAASPFWNRPVINNVKS